ncbi:MAG: pyridoxamine 5'-phosphate oxidase [Thermodesulfobacteriota bacterium]
MTNKNTQYELMELRKESLKEDPFKQFDDGYDSAVKSGIKYPDAFVLSTSTSDGLSSSRVLLYKGRNEIGFKFYTNINSMKGRELKINNNSSMCFWWNDLERQIRIKGVAELLGDEEIDEYFKSRPRGSQLSAWASDQSSVIENRDVLERKYDYYEEKFSGVDIPRPEYWKGYIVIAKEFEFWQGRYNRLHDRFLYRLENKNWIIERLAP